MADRPTLTPNSQPSTLKPSNPQPSTLNPQPLTPKTLNPKTLNPECSSVFKAADPKEVIGVMHKSVEVHGNGK